LDQGAQRKKPPEGGVDLSLVYSALARAYGWKPDFVDSLTFAQAELWLERAREEQHYETLLQAHQITDGIADLLVAAGFLKRL
jgi:hypothetical protein